MRASPIMTVLVFALLGAACNKERSPSGASTSASSVSPAAATPGSSAAATPASLYDLTVRKLDGTPAPLAEHRGKVALLVNVASECGYTPQYKGLEALYEELAPRGFVVLAFPSNDFGEQEPGSPAEIAAFAAKTYNVTFPMFEKVKTNGDDVSPVYALASRADGPPKWNFHKYLVDRKGHIVRGFSSKVTPESEELRAAVRAALDAS